jgi:hypothetical protein
MSYHFTPFRRATIRVGYSLVVQYLSSMCETLGSIPYLKRKEDGSRGEGREGKGTEGKTRAGVVTQEVEYLKW